MEILIPAVRAEANKYTDWHIDLKKSETSVLFRSQSEGEQGVKAESFPTKVPDILEALVRVITQKLTEHDENDGPRALTVVIENMRFRGERIRPNRYALRHIKGGIKPLLDLKLGDAAVEMLLDPGCRNTGGLILISGEAGAGKTTTAAATVIARLQKFGGYCLSVESPIEYELKGFHNKGYIEQIDATNSGFKAEVASAMRKFPSEIRSMFYFGEVLEETAAAELTRLIVRGHLVITTIHSNNIIGAVEMLVALAERANETYARQLIGANLIALIHQKLVKGEPIVNCIKANEAVKNIIGNPNTPLSHLVTETEVAKNKQRKYLPHATR